MRYVTWTIKRPEGVTPELTIRENGSTAEGGMMLTIDTVLGYVSDDANLTNLNEWNVTVKTQQEALALAQAVNPECFLADNGIIQAPYPDIN
jgi:hypothetical protein